MAKIYLDEDADLTLLTDKTVGIFGYGNQGRSQALNLRDSGVNVIIGSIHDRSYEQAIEDGFEVFDLSEAASRSDFLFLLIPDEIMPAVFDEHLAAGVEPGNSLVFASGYNITYKLIKHPETVDILMLAPRMVGHGVREMYLNGEGFPSLIAVDQDASGQALERCLALAKGIGSTSMGALMSSFREETLIDLFAEQVGGAYAIRRYFEVLTEAGCGPEAILLEFYASGEIISIARAYRDMGLWAQMGTHSRTSQYGQEVTSQLTDEQEQAAKEPLREVIKNLENGSFAKEWSAEQKAGFPVWNQVREDNLQHPMVLAERELYRKLGRLKD
jgi:ketol-acid reductoisomerase